MIGSFTKQDIVKRNLARKIIRFQPEDRLPTVAELTEEFSSSRGLVQNAISQFENDGVISLHKRGSRGTYVIQIDEKKLWDETGWKTLIGAAPLPYTKRHMGLATGVYTLFDRGDIPFHFAYINGAKMRGEAVMTGKFHFAIMSQVAAEMIMGDNVNLEILHVLPPMSYMGGYALAYRESEWQSREEIRIGIDPNSPDHARLILSRFGDDYSKRRRQKVKLINLPYTRMIKAMNQGEIDLTIYNQDGLKLEFVHEGVHIEPISLQKSEKDGTRAVIVASKEEYGLKELLNQILNLNELSFLQKEVMEEKRKPIY